MPELVKASKTGPEPCETDEPALLLGPKHEDWSMWQMAGMFTKTVLG